MTQDPRPIGSAPKRIIIKIIIFIPKIIIFITQIIILRIPRIFKTQIIIFFILIL
jgi:hypothetical protein